MTDTMIMADFYGNEEELDLLSEGDADIDLDESTKVSAADSFIYSLRNKGRVDMDYMSEISGLTKRELVNELMGVVIWPDPEAYEKTLFYYDSFTSKQQYLRGNLIKKYQRAKEINKDTGLFDETIKLLEGALPERINGNDIHMNLGASWIPENYVSGFVKGLLDLYIPPRIEYDSFLGKWTLEINTPPNYVKNNYTYGTRRMPALNIIKHILNAKPVKVYDQVSKKDRDGIDNVLNKDETLMAEQREQLILEEWQKYVHEDSRREKALQELYMEHYGYSVCRYDGSFLTLPGLNKDVKPYSHQFDAIARILLNHNTLLAHEVGSGKTLEYMCGCHELIRLGLGHKAVIVLPNTTFEAAVRAYEMLYPEDKASVLAVYPKKDFVPKKRTETINKIKSGDYSVIFMAYSSFDMLTLSDKYAIAQRERKLKACRDQINNAKSYTGKRNLQAEAKRLEKAIKKYKEDFKFKETACFDELGVDILVVDESHNYKNINLGDITENIVGVHSGSSKKADNMLEKVEYIESIDGHVIFATGTPITNSLADLFVIQRYLQPNELRMCNIFHFNEWISTFCSQTHSFEIDVDSRNFRFTTRFSKFHNLPELMSLFSDVCDFYQISNGDIGLPDFDGYNDILVRKSDAQREYIDEIAERTEAIRSRQVKRTEDNLLKITVDGRKCALDIRLVDPLADVSEDETKVKVCANEMAKLYMDYPDTTQIAFSDISTPKEGFNIYDELKSELINRGIPREQIMFIHEATSEAQRAKIEKRFNNGEIRVLIGSTQKLGTGANVQEKLISVHHLDVPWRPADMIQREGRIVRQGNTNKKVFIYRYVTEASFDSYTWQILENKQRFISQFLSGSLDSVHRDESDCADTVLNYAEIKALAIGNPLIKKRVEVANELEHARINQRQRKNELINIRDILNNLPRRIDDRKIAILNAKSDNRFYREYKQSVTNEERKRIGEELLLAVKNNVGAKNEREFTVYQGFSVILPKDMTADKPYVIVKRRASNAYKVKMDGDKALGCLQRIDYVLEHLEDAIKRHKEILEDLYKQKEEAQRSLDEGNEYDLMVEKYIVKLKNIDKQLEGVNAS